MAVCGTKNSESYFINLFGATAAIGRSKANIDDEIILRRLLIQVSISADNINNGFTLKYIVFFYYEIFPIVNYKMSATPLYSASDLAAAGVEIESPSPMDTSELRRRIAEKLHVHRDIFASATKRSEAARRAFDPADDDDLSDVGYYKTARADSKTAPRIPHSPPLHGIDWWTRVEERKNEAKRRKEDAVDAQMREVPTIDKNSERIAREMGRAPAESISDHLYSQALVHRQHIEDLKEDFLSKEVPAHPRITRLAAELVREGNVSDRLYDEYMEKLKEKKEKAAMRPHPCNVLPESEILAYTNDMHEKAMESLAEKRAKSEKLVQDAISRAKPVLSAKSLEIAQNLENTAMERLLKPRQIVMSPSVDPEVTFAPKINEESNRILSEKEETIKNPHIRLHKEALERRSRRQEKNTLSSREQEELKECTFQPRIKKSEESFKRTQIMMGEQQRSANERVEQRLLEWEAQREYRLKEQIRAKETNDDDLRECTFRPKINASSKNAKRAPRRALHRPKFQKPEVARRSPKKSGGGIDAFLERQRRGRAERDRRKNVPFADGSKWTGQLTVPQSPKLGTTRVRKSVRRRVADAPSQHRRNGGSNRRQASAAAPRRRRFDASETFPQNSMPPPPPPDVVAPYDDDYVDHHAQSAAAFDLGRMERMAAAAVVRGATSSTRKFSVPDKKRSQGGRSSGYGR